MSTLVTGRAVLNSDVVEDAAILIDGTTITFAGTAAGFSAAHPEFDTSTHETIAHDGWIFPGLVDIHNHGGGGWSYPDTINADDAAPAIHEHRSHGTTSIVASLVTGPHDLLLSRIDALAELCDRGELAGIHLEGPYISDVRCGAQDPAYIRAGNAAETRELLARGRGHVATMTVAPEADPDGAVTRALVEGGAIPSYGHTDCSGPTMLEAVGLARDALASADASARSAKPTATHLYNAMRPIHHRDAGPAFASIDAASRGDLIVELIADGIHTSADTVAYTFDLVADGALALVTDAMAATGMADGFYRLGSLDVSVASGIATLVQGGAIAGGTAHLLDVVRFAHVEAGVGLARVVNAASAVPARVLGLDDTVGSLAAGLHADVLLATNDLTAARVMHCGEWVAPHE